MFNFEKSELERELNTPKEWEEDRILVRNENGDVNEITILDDEESKGDE